jgi:prevent-host-death family protein
LSQTIPEILGSVLGGFDPHLLGECRQLGRPLRVVRDDAFLRWPKGGQAGRWLSAHSDYDFFSTTGQLDQFTELTLGFPEISNHVVTGFLKSIVSLNLVLTLVRIVRRFVGTNTRMNTLDVFSARDLRNRSGELLRETEAGNLTVITKHGRPAAITVPFDAELLELGLPTHLAVRLFEQRLITLAQASKLAGRSIEEFFAILGASNVDAVDYPPEELGDELDVLQ